MFSYFLNISRDIARGHMCTLHWKIKIDREAWVPPKHQIMGIIAGNGQSHTVIQLKQLRLMLLPLYLHIQGKFADHSEEHLVEAFNLSIAL